jgi:cyclic pyranopterin phosphate synthase
MMSPEEIAGIAETFVKAGIKKIRLIGGEPLIRKNVKEIIYLLASLPVELSITTNGVHVNKFIYTFKQAGLQSIHVSLDSLNPVTYYWITKKNLFAKVMVNIQDLIRHNFNVRLNIVVMKGVNDHEISEFIELTRHQPIHVQFFEYMTLSKNNWDPSKVTSYKEIVDIISQHYPIQKLSPDQSETSRKFCIPGYAGTFSTNGAAGDSFSEESNYLRLTIDGKLKNNLSPNREVDLLAPYHNKEDLFPYIHECVRKNVNDRVSLLHNNEIEERAMM